MGIKHLIFQSNFASLGHYFVLSISESSYNVAVLQIFLLSNFKGNNKNTDYGAYIFFTWEGALFKLLLENETELKET